MLHHIVMWKIKDLGAEGDKAANVAQAITKFYADHPQARRATPFVAFNGYIERGACAPFINKARAEMGLPPMKPSPLPADPQP